jgi:tRNA threonylcarbamoyladenosine biosynthesis protein TsaB
LWQDHQVIDRFALAARQHSNLLLGMVAELLAEAQIKLKNLDGVAYGQGPGSFMGVRLATGVAQGLAFGADLPVIGISSLQALAQQGQQELQEDAIVAGWDARMQEIYWGCYIKDDHGLMQPCDLEQVSSPASIEFPKGRDWVVVGNAWETYADKIKLIGKSYLLYPRAREVAILAAQYPKLISPEQAEPHYLRQQVAWKKPT